MTINFCGNIGKDAQLRTVQNGDRQDSVLSVWVAENKKKRDGSTKTLWHKVTIWRHYAESMAPYLKKGREITVTGECEAKFFVRDGVVVPYIDVQASDLKLHGGRPEEDVPPETEGEEAPAMNETPWD